MISHTVPELPFQKIGSDILEDKGKPYVVIVDYYSNWIELHPLKGKTAKDIFTVFKYVFSTHGVPAELVSDNMPYNANKIKQFLKGWDIQLSTSSPRYAKSNGMSEKALGILPRRVCSISAVREETYR